MLSSDKNVFLRKHLCCWDRVVMETYEKSHRNTPRGALFGSPSSESLRQRPDESTGAGGGNGKRPFVF